MFIRTNDEVGEGRKLQKSQTYPSLDKNKFIFLSNMTFSSSFSHWNSLSSIYYSLNGINFICVLLSTTGEIKCNPCIIRSYGFTKNKSLISIPPIKFVIHINREWQSNLFRRYLKKKSHFSLPCSASFRSNPDSIFQAKEGKENQTTTKKTHNE